MNPATKKLVLCTSAALFAGALIGFLFANNANRREIEDLRAEVARAKSAGAAGDAQAPAQNAAAAAPAMPSEREMRDLVSKADARADDAKYQHDVGQGVYMYSLAEGRPALMPEAIRLLRRAEQADPKNPSTLLLLGNAHFALGQNGDAAKYEEARRYYREALKGKPDDANLHTLHGMTYYFGRPSDPQRAIEGYRRALTLDPRHEMALQNLAAALVAAGSADEAARHVAQLEQVNPSNRELANLRAQLAQARNAAGGRK